MADNYEVYPPTELNTNTTLINIKEASINEMDTYIGRKNKHHNLDKSVFANPYSVSEYGRRVAVSKYKMHFFKNYLEDEEFREKTHNLEGETLGCWCYPSRCHGEVIIDLLDNYVENGFIGSLNHIKKEIDTIKVERLGREGFVNRQDIRKEISQIEGEMF